MPVFDTVPVRFLKLPAVILFALVLLKTSQSAAASCGFLVCSLRQTGSPASKPKAGQTAV
jgi:hypothetical protein